MTNFTKDQRLIKAVQKLGTDLEILGKDVAVLLNIVAQDEN